MVSEPTIMDPVANNPSPLLLLNNMSNLIILMVQHSSQDNSLSEDGDQTLNPAFLIWRKKDKGITDLASFNTVLSSTCHGCGINHISRKSGTEQSMAVASESFSNSALAMFVSNKVTNLTMALIGGPRLQQSYQQSSNPISQPSSQPGSYGWILPIAYQGKNPPTKLAAMASASNLHYTQSSETWLTDSGASDHITANASTLNSQTPYQGTEQVTVGNGQNLPIQSIVHKLCLDNNCSCHFDAHKLLIQDLPTGRLLYKGLSKDGVYPINSSQFCTSASSKTACFASSSAQKWELWHSRLGHPSAKVLHTIFPSLSSCNSLAS
uniref:GAG-pre-integrase domain-containing protein n=1 Tax=Fagus sylvatica TaxID=28930 RepID=A0A2N9GL86_FAGSY